jgi:hypothetical protein
VTDEDEITRVLRVCEETLRTLASQGRLATEALSAFIQLSARVTQAMERRRDPDRRQTPRPEIDRRASTVWRNREDIESPRSEA